ncbi:MAG: ABC transporter ATP-binding protein/permease [Phycisphaerales bacterium]|nr:ABC transporter ATP-binding protein/permease [Phycisphaerales bacterium]
MKRLLTKTYGLLERNERRQLHLLVVLMLMQACLEVVSIGSILPFMGLVEYPERIHSTRITAWAYETFGFTNDKSFLIAFGVFVLALFLIVNTVNAMSLWAQARFSWMRSFSISRRLLAAYLSMPYPFFLQRNSSDFTRGIYQEVRQVIMGIILPSVTLLSRGISIVLIILLLLYINWWLSLGMGILFSGTYAIVFLTSQKKLQDAGERIVEANETCYRITNEAFGGIKEAKLGGLESAYVDAFVPPGMDVARMNTRRSVIAGVPRYILEAIAFGGMLALLLIMLSTTGSIDSIIPVASVFAFAGYRLMPSLSQVFVSVANIRSSTASLDVVVDDLEAARKAMTRDDDVAAIEMKTGVTLRDMSFDYSASTRPVLSGIDLEIKCGESVAIVGPTGSGKTTMVDILLGLLLPSSGSMLVDDSEITAKNVRGWQKNVGYVPQGIFLSDDTITSNITFGIPRELVDHEKVRHAARVAGLDTFIENELREGYDTRIGERGIRLSGGQVQRLGIARAIYRNPPVLFLDEATSALDSQTERRVMDGIRDAAEDRTVIVIAHRLSTVRFCNRIIVLDSGRITDMGSWDELMERCELFRHLAGEEEAENL